MVRSTPVSVAIIASPFKKERLSDGSIRIEKVIGNTTDILLATVVTEIPASLDERATRKNITMKRKPINMDKGIQSAESSSPGSNFFAFNINPIMEATR